MDTIVISKAFHLPVDDTNFIQNLNVKEIVTNSLFRRKLTRLSKIVLLLTENVLEETKIPIVFGTAYGELYNICSILNNIKYSKSVLPIDFQNSVHNTSAAYCSIFYKNDSPIDTISCGNNTSYETLWTAYIKLISNNNIKQILAISADSYLVNSDIEIFSGLNTRNRESAAAILLEKKSNKFYNKITIVNNDIYYQNKTVDICKGYMESTSFMITVAKISEKKLLQLEYK